VEPWPYPKCFLGQFSKEDIVMPTYAFHLHDGPAVPPRVERIDAYDDEEARTLAELRLTLSSGFTHIEVERDGVELFRLHRDSQEPL